MHTEQTHTRAHTYTHTAVTHSHSLLFSTASDKCEIHSVCTKTWLGREIISVIELMGLSETGEQPRGAKEEKREEKKKGKKRKKKTWLCALAGRKTRK